MAYEDLNSVWRTDLEPAPKYILLRVADRLNREKGIAWPGVRSLAKDTGYSRPTVMAWVDWMLRRGILQLARESRGTTSRAYWIDFEALACYSRGTGARLRTFLAKQAHAERIELAAVPTAGEASVTARVLRNPAMRSLHYRDLSAGLARIMCALASHAAGDRVSFAEAA